ncbi:MAG: hypothetical protein ACXWA9_14490 [Acidimicrobiia bacterium]
MRRRRMLGAALAVTIAGTALVSGGQAWAAGPKGKITCTTVTGTATGTVTISGCSGTGNTGGASNPLPTASLAVGGTVTWVSGKTSTFGVAALVATKATKCPGYVKPPKTGPAPTEPTAFKFSGAVTADNSGMKVPGKFKGAVCVSTSGDITALKVLKVN